MKATWNGATVAESDDTVVVEGNHYFPESSLKREYVTFSNHRSTCPWKGQAQYYSLIVNRRDERERGLVLPRAERGRPADQGPRRVLEGRAGELSHAGSGVPSPAKDLGAAESATSRP